MLLLAIALALHFAPAGEEFTSVRNVEMPEVCVEGRYLAEVGILLTDSLGASCVWQLKLDKIFQLGMSSGCACVATGGPLDMPHNRTGKPGVA